MSIKKVLKISVCGSSAVGKSSIGCRLSDKEPYPEHVSTIGVDFFIKHLPLYSAKINIWDLAGDSRFQSITYAYVKGSDILILVYDMSRPSSVRELREIHEAYKKNKIPNIRSIVVGNKSDMGNSCMNSGINFAFHLGAPHITVSAKNNIGFDQLLDTILSLSRIESTVTDSIPEVEVNYINIKDIMRSCNKCIIS